MVSRKFITDFSLFLMVKSHRQICQALPLYCADSTACDQTFARCSTSRQNSCWPFVITGDFFFLLPWSVHPTRRHKLPVFVIGGVGGGGGGGRGLGALATRIPYPKKPTETTTTLFHILSLALSFFFSLSAHTLMHTMQALTTGRANHRSDFSSTLAGQKKKSLIWMPSPGAADQHRNQVNRNERGRERETGRRRNIEWEPERERDWKRGKAGS